MRINTISFRENLSELSERFEINFEVKNINGKNKLLFDVDKNNKDVFVIWKENKVDENNNLIKNTWTGENIYWRKIKPLNSENMKLPIIVSSKFRMESWKNPNYNKSSFIIFKWKEEKENYNELQLIADQKQDLWRLSDWNKNELENGREKLLVNYE